VRACLVQRINSTEGAANSSAFPFDLTILAAMLGVVVIDVTGLAGMETAGFAGIGARAGIGAADGVDLLLVPTVVQPAAGGG